MDDRYTEDTLGIIIASIESPIRLNCLCSLNNALHLPRTKEALCSGLQVSVHNLLPKLLVLFLSSQKEEGDARFL